MTRLLSLISGLTLLLAACGSAAQPGAAPPSASVAVAASAKPSAASPSASQADTPVPAKSAAPAPSTPLTVVRPPMPSELIIPAIHVDAPVEHVGTTPDGAMDVPKQWNDVAWFDLGYRPGEVGSAVIAGHLDSTTDKAVFWDLHLLKPGDQVQLKAEDGSQKTFSVVSDEVYAFDQAPLQKIFGAATQPMLNLVTCNGTFDRGSKNYDKRLVVYTRQIK
ncbi:MAG: class F sortase [Chloroflexi bacterium]|nr:class F sortase [Chloroflexota bacterium]